MKKLKEYSVLTPKISYILEIYEDPQKDEFIGEITGQREPRFPEMGEGKPFSYIQLIESEAIRNPDLETLMTKCKERMIQLGGEILVFRELGSKEDS
jgi:hypothetical protein